MNRRDFILSLGAGLAITPAASWALDNAGASSLIDALVGDINSAIDSGKGDSALFREFERIFSKYSDTSYIAAYAMGVEARRASGSQKKAFSKAFQGYISRKYGRRFREFIGGRLEVTGVKKVKKWYEVDTVAYLKGQSPFKVTFLVSDRSGKDKFFNMYIEGVNLLLTERTEIGAIIDRNKGDIDKTIAQLKTLG